MSDPYEIEIRASHYPHPERKHGQHTNGPASLFIRRVGGPWRVVIGTHQIYVVRAWIREIGLDAVLARHCLQIKEPNT